MHCIAVALLTHIPRGIEIIDQLFHRQYTCVCVCVCVCVCMCVCVCVQEQFEILQLELSRTI